ncbi:MAG: hypothetical protein QF714_13235 [Dehalococcoidia bacterium]|jgi:hypothetical protein|nr:hypothetical protein [Dehalococcoidia bacterium]MDP6228647.1 hypothetical protein [Dehalococcoidia bacterium]MDP7084344.1 hypothetical protein [Dehalococcoidia bacterium]MDP7201254.1 hypothetical protein [Dehalococcoidia bacterium]MDP7511473.1 hypothetical protein [Dehalococcoidia bacterium]
MQPVGIAEKSVELGLSPDTVRSGLRTGQIIGHQETFAGGFERLAEVDEEPIFIKMLKAELERLHVGISQLHQLPAHRPPPPALSRRRSWA